MTGSLQRMRHLLEFLDSNHWLLARENSRFFVYSPPTDSREPSGYELVVPRDPAGPDFDRSLDSCLEALASFYRSPVTSIEARLLPVSEVVSLRLEGEEFREGAAPFSKFERMLEHFKRTIIRTAAFVLTDDPVTQAVPPAARSFLDDCWFLQTARGSFVTRVALPASGAFGPVLSLFTRPVEKSLVVLSIRNISTLIADRVLRDDPDLLSDDGFRGIRDVVSVGVLEEMSKLLRGAGARSFTFLFDRLGEEKVVALPQLTDDRLFQLDSFIVQVRERLHETFALSVEGRVFEVRRSRRRSSSSFVGVSADVEGRQQDISFKVEPDVLPVFLEHFRSGVPIHVQGRARRLRTQIRIEGDFSYDEIR